MIGPRTLAALYASAYALAIYNHSEIVELAKWLAREWRTVL